MNQRKRPRHTWMVVAPMPLRSRPYSGRAGRYACCQNRDDERLGKPLVRPIQELKGVPTSKPVANAQSQVVVLEVGP